jgi:hypothetical protein
MFYQKSKEIRLHLNKNVKKKIPNALNFESYRFEIKVRGKIVKIVKSSIWILS